MNQKVIVITGANGNLGSALVKHFINLNWLVVGIVHRCKNIQSVSSCYHEIELDLLNELAVKECVDTILNQFGDIDIAVLTAGGFDMGNVEQTSFDDIKKQIQLNFETAYNIARPLFLQMKKSGSGKIYFIGSLAGMDTNKSKDVTAYGLSKSLLFQLANILNAEVSKSTIKAHVVVPSIIDTPQNRQTMPDADYSLWQKPDSIAKIIANTTTQKGIETILLVSNYLN